MKTMKIKIPKNFMNCAVTLNNNFVADTNDTQNWDTMKIQLPEGSWKVYRTDVKNKMVYLINEEEEND